MPNTNMKNLIFLFLSLISFSTVYSQEFDSPSEGKSLVYFVRSSGTGAMINFKYFDGEKYLGKLNGVHYFKYECEPGEHVFWAAAENRDYLEGNLKANSTYLVEVRPTMGAMKAAVRLHSVSPDNEKFMKKVSKIMSRRSASELNKTDEDLDFFIKNGIERFERLKSDGKVKTINSEDTFN